MSEPRDEIAKTLLLSTWEHYDKAVGRLGIAVVVALLIHLQVAQYLEFNGDIIEAKVEEQQLSSQLVAATDVGTAVSQLRDNLDKTVRSVMKDFAPGMRKQFLALDEQFPSLVSPTVQKLLPARRSSTGPRQEDGEGDGLETQNDGASPLAHRNVANMMLQSAPTAQNRPIELTLSDQSKAEIAAARTIEELTDALHKIAEREIVEPVFEKLNQRWSNDCRAAAVAKINAVLEKLDTAKVKLPTEAAAWEEVQRALQDVRQTIEVFEFQQPQGRWWSTVRGKLETGMNLTAEASDRMIERLPSEVIERVSSALRDALDRQSKIAGSLEDQLQTVQEQFLHLKERAASLGKPFEMISLDLKTTAEHFPLLAGLGCAAGLAWLGYWRGRLLRAASWMRLDESDSQSLSPLPFLDGGPRTRSTSELILGVIGIGWIVIVVWQLHRATGSLNGNAITEAAIGVAAIVLALVYRAHTATSVVKVSVPRQGNG